MNRQAAHFWDEWWRARLAKGASDTSPTWAMRINLALNSLANPRGPRLFNVSWGTLFNLACDNSLLVQVMRDHGLQTVLCAGNGISHEPHRLAAAGFDVTALDISRVAVNLAKTDAEGCTIPSPHSPIDSEVR